MNQYIIDTEFAVKNLIQLATDEEGMLEKLAAELTQVEAQLRVYGWDFETSDLNDDFSEVYVMAAFSRMAEAAAKTKGIQGKLATLQASIGTRQRAIQAISGAILQIAKQGISLVHGSLVAAPEGRKIGTASLKQVIWQARNQALHYEEGNFHQSVTDLFANLEAEQGAQFSLANHPNQSLAKQVVILLGWNKYTNYIRDMQSLLP
ncbi:MAG: hypothetical protein KUA37_11930 [Desulfomicrobium sp.]|nr:hypothetical protein [Desulfomicrobium sp.]MBV1718644.1 hypothetical protein [Desulfomicrobium sp.]